MEYVVYGSSSKQVSRLGFGGWQLGSDATWGEMSQEDGVALVQAALRRGIRFFDTAPGYSFGRSETILGLAMADDRETVVINSKFGHNADGTSDFSVEAIEPSIRSSLKRLKTTYLDSVLLHNPEMAILSGKTGHFDKLDELRERGLIRAFGVSCDTEEEVKAVLATHRVQVIELLFNVFFQAPRECFDEIAKQGIALIVKVPLDSGWLTGKYRANAVFSGVRSRWSKEQIARRAGLVEELSAIAKSNDLTPLALGFIASFPAVTTIIPGIKSVTQLEGLIFAIDQPFSNHLQATLTRFYDERIANDPLWW